MKEQLSRLLRKLANVNPDSLLSISLLGLLLVAYIVGVYFVVIALGTLPFGRSPSQSLLPVPQQQPLNLFALLAIAVTFVPVSRWLLGRVNDLIYAQHDNPYTLVATVNQQLQAMTNPQLTLPLVLETVASDLHLPYLRLELDELALPETLMFGVPPPKAQLRPFHVTYLERPLGILLVSDRAGNRPLSDSDHQIMRDIARLIGIALTVTRLTADLQTSREQLIIAREEERRRIRNDLHDGLAPSLSSFQLQLSAIRTFMEQNPSEANKLIEELSEDMRQATAEIRRLVYDLRPPMLDDLGLVAAIKHIRLHGSSLRLEVTAPEPMPSLSAATEVAVFRIASEAIHNVVKHTEATCCMVVITKEAKTLVLRVNDDGRNPTVSHTAGIGIQSMQERAAELGGSFSIHVEENGTRVEVRLPLEMT